MALRFTISSSNVFSVGKRPHFPTPIALLRHRQLRPPTISSTRTVIIPPHRRHQLTDQKGISITTTMALHSVSGHLLRSTDSPAPQFLKDTLSKYDLQPDPLSLFEQWFHSVKQAGEKAPETTTLTTVRMPEGRPSSRIVYLKQVMRAESGTHADGTDAATPTTTPAKDGGGDVIASGFVIYSNWGTSRKAADLATNPLVSLTFWWPSKERQVRVQGRTVKLMLGPSGSTTSGQDGSEAQEYYSTRPRGSRIGAWASRQSSVIDDGRTMLDGWVREQEERWGGREDIPCPPFWGGVLIVPDEIEFWQGRECRLHDRFLYKRVGGLSGIEFPPLKFPGMTTATATATMAEGKGEGSRETEPVVVPDGQWTVERLSP